MPRRGPPVRPGGQPVGAVVDRSSRCVMCRMVNTGKTVHPVGSNRGGRRTAPRRQRRRGGYALRERIGAGRHLQIGSDTGRDLVRPPRNSSTKALLGECIGHRRHCDPGWSLASLNGHPPPGMVHQVRTPVMRSITPPRCASPAHRSHDCTDHLHMIICQICLGSPGRHYHPGPR